MNIIITGPKHCGKSTVINKLISRFPGRISGFISEFDHRESCTRELLIRNITGSLSCCAVKWQSGLYEVFPEAFDEFAAEQISLQSDLVIIDELGKFEKNCAKLEKAVIDIFNSERSVVASIRLDAAGWMQELKKRCDTKVFTVTEECRDSLPSDIMELLKQSCQNR